MGGIPHLLPDVSCITTQPSSDEEAVFMPLADAERQVSKRRS
jgi:hypothetical protein